MNLKEVHRVLNDFYQKELTNGRKRHIVFWYDEEGEFLDDIDEINLENVRKWQITDYNLFATKYELEKNDPNAHFLLYANMPKPLPREDWLYDLYTLGFEFTTDKITVIMRELGIKDNAQRDTFKTYKSFFNSNARLHAFRKYPVDIYTEEAIDLTVLAALCKSATNGMDDIIKTLMRKQKEEDNKPWEEIQKYGNEDKFWLLVEKYYGYTLPEKSLQSLLIFFMITYLEQQDQSINLPTTWQHYVSSRPTNVVVFMDQWMNHREDRIVFNALADQVAELVKVNQYIEAWDVNHMVNLDVFSAFDEQMIRYLVGQLHDNLTHFDQYVDMIAARRKLHWYPEYQQEYEAIFQAVQLLANMEKLDYFIPEQSARQMFEAYVNDYYVIDTAYRKFYVAYDQIEENESLYQLREKIENVYVNRFIGELAIKWSGSLEKSADQEWPIAGVSQQKDFYRNWVQSYQNNEERVFVIISDALRYEIAKELMDELNNQRKATAEMTAIQSVLPSYTALGMAALLPYKQLAYKDDAKVLLDGINSAGISGRNEIIQQAVPDAMAIQYNELSSLNRTALREKLQGKRVIYIYHNTIDARGDNAATEMEVFQAAEEAIKDIQLLINRLVNNVSASNILITADHGFVYERDTLQNSQKLPREKEATLLTSRRFLITDNQAAVEGTLTYAMDYILQQAEKRFVTVPKGINRFAIQGAGANYVHGGAMLQEIVVPVITFKNDRSKSSTNMVSKVDVKLTTPTRKITNTIAYLEFFQTEKTADKKLPLNLKLYFVDEAGNRVSNENRIIADSVSSQGTERAYREKFVFKSIAYDKHKTYYLVLEDEAERVETVYERYAFTIDIAFTDDYGF